MFRGGVSESVHTRSAGTCLDSLCGVCLHRSFQEVPPRTPPKSPSPTLPYE